MRITAARIFSGRAPQRNNHPFVPAQAGTQHFGCCTKKELDPRFRGDARSDCRSLAYLTVSARPLRSALTIAPTELPVSVSTAPFWLVSTIACAPRPTAAPTLPAA
jgi:hypothetical protein